MGCLLDDLIAFGIKTDRWTISAQDADEWYKTVNKGAEFFMTKWIAAESQGCTMACSSVSERDGKDQREGSTKQASSY